MASNLFGKPVTNATLRVMPEYAGQRITNDDRARVAMEMKNEEEKDVKAREFAEKCKRSANLTGTYILIYNATGRSVTLAAVRDYIGNTSGAPYPIIIQNGQWGALFHYKPGDDVDSGAVVYDGYSGNGNTQFQYVLTWRNKTGSDVQVFNEIRPLGYYPPSSTNDPKWTSLRAAADAHVQVHHKASDNDCVASSSFSTTNPQWLEAILYVPASLSTS